MLDQVVESGEVTGTVWLDENRNGIQDANESPLPNVVLYLETDIDNLQSGGLSANPVYYPTFNVETDENGQFTFSGVFVNHPIRVGYTNLEANNLTVTSANEGDDDSIDSDFFVTRELFDRAFYSSDGFMVEESGSVNTIGLGLYEN